MDEFINNNGKFNKNIIFYFDIGLGGIGDYLKYFIYAFDYCLINKINFNFINKHKLNNYIICKYSNWELTEYPIEKTLRINKIHDLTEEFVKNDTYQNYLVYPVCMYGLDEYIICKQYILNDFFYFSNEIIEYANKMFKCKEYISVHLRLGDKYLETSRNYIQCIRDKRIFDENKLNDFFIHNNLDNIYFFCDNNSFKKKIKNKFQNVNMTGLQIAHTSLLNTNESQLLDTITEFYIMTNSKCIYMFSNSGFPIMASRFNNINLISYF